MNDLGAPRRVAERRQGHYAGAVSRLFAFAADIGISWGLYVAGVAVLGLLTGLISGTTIHVTDYRWAAGTTLLAWMFAYFSYQWALGGRTLGMAIFGIRVLRADGVSASAKAAVIRTLTLPLSFALFGLGLLGILVQKERRAFHDLCAGTCVVYSWDARAATLRWLARQAQPGTAPPP
jgi:uncharacterized RDD family membrane protein YckC